VLIPLERTVVEVISLQGAQQSKRLPHLTLRWKQSFRNVVFSIGSGEETWRSRLAMVQFNVMFPCRAL
jgi:hypothetical protein